MYKRHIRLWVLALCIFILTGCDKSEIELRGRAELLQYGIDSEVAGKIGKINKKSGEPVSKDEVLIEINSSDKEFEVREQEAAVKLKQLKLDELKQGARAEQLKQAEAVVRQAKAKLDELRSGTRPEQLKQAEAAMNSSQANYDYINDKYQRLLSLYKSNSVPENDLLELRDKLNTSKQEMEFSRLNLELLSNGATGQSLDAAQANYEQALSQLEFLKNGATGIEIEKARADLEQSTALLELKKVNSMKYKITAPCEGIFEYSNLNVGKVLDTGDKIGMVYSRREFIVNALVPFEDVHSVKLGQEVELKPDIPKAVLLKGKVDFIAAKVDLVVPDTEIDIPKESTYYALKVKVLEPPESLKNGTPMDMRIFIR